MTQRGQMKSVQLLGKGSFGCVVKPTVACKPGSGGVSGARFAPGTAFVSKLHRGNAGAAVAAEFAHAELMSAADPEHAFSVGVRGWCAPQFDDDADSASYAEACAGDYTLGDQIIYEDGGATALDIMNVRPLHARTVLTVLQSFVNLLEGLVAMNQPPGIVHMDIKTNNIVVDMATAKARFIDYGSVRRYDDIVNLADPGILKRTYWVWPPEWDYLGTCLRKYVATHAVDAETRALATGTAPPRSAGSKYAAANEKLTEWGFGFAMPQQAALLATARTFGGRYPLDAADSLQQLCSQFTREFANKLDIFGMGAAVAQMAHAGASLLPERLNLALRQWIARATDPYPYARFTPEEALDAYRHIWAEADAATSLGGSKRDRRYKASPRRRRSRSKTPRRSRRKSKPV